MKKILIWLITAYQIHISAKSFKQTTLQVLKNIFLENAFPMQKPLLTVVTLTVFQKLQPQWATPTLYISAVLLKRNMAFRHRNTPKDNQTNLFLTVLSKDLNVDITAKKML